jgi:hypothetical protein
MPINHPTTVDALHLDGVLLLDVDRGVAVVDLAWASFVDAYALTAVACFIASSASDGLRVELVMPEHPDVRSWLSRMHLGDVVEHAESSVGGFIAAQRYKAGMPEERIVVAVGDAARGCRESSTGSRGSAELSGSGAARPRGR